MGKAPGALCLAARYVFPVSSPPIADGVVVIREGRIVEVGRRSRRLAVADLGSAALLPGLTNAHVHWDLSDLDEPLGWPGIRFTDWVRLVLEHRRQRGGWSEAAVERGMGESRRAGTTAAGEVAQAGGVAPPGGTAQFGGVAFRELIGPTAQRVQAAMAGAHEHLQCPGWSSPWRPGLCAHAPYTVHPQLLTRLVALSHEKQIPLAMHVAETRDELELLCSGTGPLRRLLEDLEAWDPDAFSRGGKPLDVLRLLVRAHRALVIHGNYLDEEEIALAAQHKERVAVVYCPRSHDYFGHDPYPLAQLLAAGLTVALGTDSRASSPDLGMLGELRHLARRGEVAPPVLLRMATLHGARALGLDRWCGTLQPGKWADLTAVALPETRSGDPHELLLDSQLPVVARFFRGQRDRCGERPAILGTGCNGW